MLSNPAANTLFVPTFVTIGTILGGGLALLLVVERRHLRELWRRTIFQRWFTWLIIAPVYAIAVLCGSVGVLLLVTGLVFAGLREYARLVGLPPLYTRVLVAMGVLLGPIALVSYELYLAIPPLLLIIGTLQPVLTQDVRSGTRHLAFAALGFAYVPWLLGHFLLLDMWVDGGPGILLALGVAIALSDVGAYVVGRLLGRRRLAPVLSPNKICAGVGGNVLGCYVGLGVMQFALPDGARALLLASLPLLVGLGAVWGDLVESLVKREFGARDAGDWLPGFGGILDRIDSLIFVAPLSYFYLRVVQAVTG